MPRWTITWRPASGCSTPGFDPTAPSLQAGNLVPLLMLRRAQLRGHRPIVVVGGATGLIGDPSGRGDERTLRDAAMVEEWVEAIRRQVSGFLDLEGACAARVVNNLDWTQPLSAIDFLRGVGKHFSVAAMIGRDSVRSRLERDGAGISYTEFSYMLLQAYDFLELARRYDCTVQLGGSDQWGNIVSGVDLVRRVTRRAVYALTAPLVTRQDGVKFGKTAAGAVWLDAASTSPYAFFQFWMNVADADVGAFLRYFTLLDMEDIAQAEALARARPERREAQRLLAREATRLVHGEGGLKAARAHHRRVVRRRRSGVDAGRAGGLGAGWHGGHGHRAGRGLAHRVDAGRPCQFEQRGKAVGARRRHPAERRCRDGPGAPFGQGRRPARPLPCRSAGTPALALVGSGGLIARFGPDSGWAKCQYLIDISTIFCTRSAFWKKTACAC